MRNPTGPGDAPASGSEASRPGPAEPSPEIVVTRGKRIYLRTFTRADLKYLDEWAEDPYLDRMVGSEFLSLYKAYEKDASFYDAVLNDPTQIALMVVTNEDPARPVGLVRLMNIHQADGD